MSDYMLPPNDKKHYLLAALVKAQLDITAPDKDKVNTQFGSKYSSLDQIYAACRIPLARNGLTIMHTVEFVDQKYSLITTLLHVSGETMANRYPMFVTQAHSQGFAAALTYARRYAICSLIGLPSEEDDDGNAATEMEKNPPKIKPPVKGLNAEQVGEIVAQFNGDGAIGTRILNSYKVGSFDKIPESEFETIMKKLRGKNETTPN